jgi:hypothetical protein
LVEAANEAGEEFGMERLAALIVDSRKLGLEGMLANVEKAVNAYRAGVEAADNATMMLLRVSGE